MGRILTVEQVAEKLQVKPNTVRAWLRKGRIPGRKIGRVYRVAEDELDAFVNAVPEAIALRPKRRLSARGIMGKYARAGGSVDDFMREKHEEVEEEERRWEQRHKAS